MTRKVSADSTTTEAARALASGNPLRALSLVGRAESAIALTLRGIAFAQIGDLELATTALELAIERAGEPRTRAHARAALVEIALANGDPGPASRAARSSAEELANLGDARNAAMMRLVQARAEVLLGRLNEARHLVDEIVADTLPPDVRALLFMARAEIAIRGLSPTRARDALATARTISPQPLLTRALDAMDDELTHPIARVLRRGQIGPADLFTVEAASQGGELLVDACRVLVHGGRVTVPLARRQVLFALLLELARAYPEPVPRDELAARAFEVRRVNPSHRARLRVEIGRLRKVIEDLAAEPVATREGYALRSERDIVVLLPPSDDRHARIALLLGDGASWSAQGLAEHAGVSKRTAQRALAALVESGGAIRVGKGRDQRYARPGAPIASRMLLLGLLPTP